MRQNVSELLEASYLELLRRVSIHSDLQAWAAFQQSLQETVLTWLHEHPVCEAACRLQSERHFVTLAFERLRKAAVQGQVICETLSEVLMFLRASLNGAILETLRISERPEAVSSPWTDGGDCPDRSEVCDRLQARLSNQREQRLAFLLYHCGLEPGEIVRCCPQQWNDINEVAHLRRSIVMQLMKSPELSGTNVHLSKTETAL